MKHVNQARNLVSENLASAPTSPITGRRYFDTTRGVERYYNGSAWVDLDDPVWVGPSTPTSALEAGDLWWDTDEVAMGTTLPLGVTDGGTGATSPATARASLAVPAIGNSTTTAGAPTTGTWARGDQWLDSNNVVWTCVTAGTPGVWRAQMGSVTTSLRVYGPFSVSTPSISPNTEATSTAYAHGLGVVPTLVLAEAEDGSFAAWCSFRVVRDATNISFTVANKHSSQPAAAVIRFLIFV